VFGSRAHAIVTLTVVIEVGIAGWILGHGTLWLLGATLAVTAADTIWGMTRRRVLADLVGLEVAVVLAILLSAEADPMLSLLVAAACVAWLIRPERQPTGVD
jgi:hypothetical protein